MTVERLLDRFVGGHCQIGRVTVYGRNAMHWGVNVYTRRWGYVCFRLPFRCFGHWWPLYFYASPDATPWAATFMLAKSREYEPRLATLRRRAFGHNFDVDANYPKLAEINGYALESDDAE